MNAISVTKARANIYRLLEEVNTNAEPVRITNSRGGSGILISESGWNEIQETLYIHALSGRGQMVREAEGSPIEIDFSKAGVHV